MQARYFPGEKVTFKEGLIEGHTEGIVIFSSEVESQSDFETNERQKAIRRSDDRHYYINIATQRYYGVRLKDGREVRVLSQEIQDCRKPGE
jgi:hypothetical protein